jgi:hypothetical protein
VVLAGGSTSRAADSQCATQWWTQARQNACSTGSLDDPAAPSPSNAAKVRLVWAKQFDGAVGNPIVNDRVVYVVSGDVRGRLHALDLTTGRLKWRSTNPRYGIAGRVITNFANGLSPVMDGNVLLRYSASGNTLRRFDPRTGRVYWRRRASGLDESASSPQVLAEGDWYQSKGEELVAYDEHTGKHVWNTWLICWQSLRPLALAPARTLELAPPAVGFCGFRFIADRAPRCRSGAEP